MARREIDEILHRVELLALEIETFVPLDNRNVQFRANLAGLLVVAMAAAYETCVKETLVSYASRHHSKFAIFAQNQFSKLSSKIRINHLYGYASVCDTGVHQKFGQILVARKQKLKTKIGQDFTKSYDQILEWRHNFAHEGIKNTTVEEALATHTLAKRVLYAFDMAFQ